VYPSASTVFPSTQTFSNAAPASAPIGDWIDKPGHEYCGSVDP
jgi:hypothetical protein